VRGLERLLRGLERHRSSLASLYLSVRAVSLLRHVRAALEASPSPSLHRYHRETTLAPRVRELCGTTCCTRLPCLCSRAVYAYCCLSSHQCRSLLTASPDHSATISAIKEPDIWLRLSNNRINSHGCCFRYLDAAPSESVAAPRAANQHRQCSRSPTDSPPRASGTSRALSRLLRASLCYFLGYERLAAVVLTLLTVARGLAWLCSTTASAPRDTRRSLAHSLLRPARSRSCTCQCVYRY